MSVAVCTLGCTRKRNSIHSWDTLTQLEGDYNLYINWELQKTIQDFKILEDIVYLEQTYEHLARLNKDVPAEVGFQRQAAIDTDRLFIDVWSWQTQIGAKWRSQPRFDQDQARLASIVTARNMCIEFAMQTGASHLLFIDADIIPPLDIIPKMLEVEEDAVCGLVNGRGTHSSLQYIFGEKREYVNEKGIRLKEVEHANIGYTMLSKRLFNQIRFRYGVSEYPDGRNHSVSDDPAFHLDAFIKFGKWPVIRMDVVGRHVGELLENEISQF